MRREPSNEAWAQNKVAGFPVRWRRRLLSQCARELSAANALPAGAGFITDAVQKANRALCEITEKLSRVRLPLDAQDGDICTKAEELAVQAMDIGRMQHTIEAVRAGMESFVRSCQLEPPHKKVSDRGAISRMTCRDWWRRGLRKMHAKAVEGAAIKLGYVNRARDLYVSNESLARRQQQIRRNNLMMENTLMRNELEQEFTLAKLAEKGTGNKAIRRGELMTRIAGFEHIAVDCKHVGLFFTVTCPSRMHKWISAGSRNAFENTRYDGTTPKEAQAYLSRCYARVRAKLARHGAGVYGFRIAEPHHDGCPHWHILLFCAAWSQRRVVRTLRHYFLQDSAEEAGAQKHRVKLEKIDWKRGSAAGYIAKYVAKNIDGLYVGDDLFGNPAMETSARVEAWASTWGIRQFQQVGGAPVGVWRELRRVVEIPEEAPEHLKAAHLAVNKIEAVGEKEGKAADWAAYTVAQGGVFCGRDALIKLEKEADGRIGQYGEAVAAAPVGVVTLALVVRSVRHVWEVVKRGFLGAILPPWTRVNNCTRNGSEKIMQTMEKVVFSGSVACT